MSSNHQTLRSKARREGVHTKKALYGFEHTPKFWNKRIGNFLIKLEFTKCTLKHGVCMENPVKPNKIIMCLYVDDLLIT